MALLLRGTLTMLDKLRDIDLDVAELLVCADFLKPNQLDRAHAAHRDTGKPLCVQLIENRLVDPRIIKAAVDVVKEVREGRLSKEKSRTALYLIGNYRLSLQDA